MDCSLSTTHTGIPLRARLRTMAKPWKSPPTTSAPTLGAPGESGLTKRFVIQRALRSFSMGFRNVACELSRGKLGAGYEVHKRAKSPRRRRTEKVQPRHR